MAREKIRVLVVKPGLDGHNVGAKLVARALRDAGMEVIYTEGVRPEEIARLAVQEDVQVVGLSILSGAHKALLPKVVRLLREAGKGDTLVVAGGVIPPEDVPLLKEKGIAEVFLPGTPTESMVGFIKGRVG